MTIQANGKIHNPPLPDNFANELLVLREGKGVYVWDVTGKRYLDFGSGIAVNSHGYGRKDLADIAAEQMKKLIHTSNLFTSEPTIQLAKKMVKSGPWDAVFFGNSGTEANEAALKYARLYAHRVKGPGHHKILSFANAFHGRTMGALSATPNPAYQEAFAPMVPGMESCAFNDEAALTAVLDGSFAAVIVEVVQGEGGLAVMKPAFAKALNRLCKEHDIILIADEVQTGMGRLGSLYGHDQVGLKPDIVTLAKPLAGGLPLSATLIPAKINKLLKIGDHGTTFGGGPVTTAVAGHLWDITSSADFLQEVNQRAALLRGRLAALAADFTNPHATFSLDAEPRGLGMLFGLAVQTSEDRQAAVVAGIIQIAMEEGILLLRSGKNVIRIAPPLTITEEEMEEGLDILRRSLERALKEL